MKKYIFWKLENGKKKTIKEVSSLKTKEEIRKEYKNVKCDGIDSVNCNE